MHLARGAHGFVGKALDAAVRRHAFARVDDLEVRRDLFSVLFAACKESIKDDGHIVFFVSAVFHEQVKQAVTRFCKVARAGGQLGQRMDDVVAVDDEMLALLRHRLTPYPRGARVSPRT